jgi:hypothetical protein
LNPASRSLPSITFASLRLKSYSPMPRALTAPGLSAVCPTSTMTRKVAGSHRAAGGGGFPAWAETGPAAQNISRTAVAAVRIGRRCIER